jgi:8-oxo-dGTP pyrophosphatase MutT (NUDIX family)
VREVWEETGLTCDLGVELVRSRYDDAKGRPKVVRYWAMQPVDGDFAPNDEVDEIRWLSLGKAAKLLTYPRDRPVLEAFERVRRRSD